MEILSIKKVCNAFITKEILSELSGKDLDFINNPVAKRLGGLWAAGTLSIDGAWITFLPKGIEQAPDFKREGFRIALTNVTDVRWRFGLLSGIVHIRHTGGEFGFRCYGAWQVARVLSVHTAGRSVT